MRFAVDQAPPAVLVFITPKASSSEPRPVILWIHGGGYVPGSADQLNGYLSVLASNGFTIANLEYSLSPENLYPVAMRQAVCGFTGHPRACPKTMGGSNTGSSSPAIRQGRRWRVNSLP